MSDRHPPERPKEIEMTAKERVGGKKAMALVLAGNNGKAMKLKALTAAALPLIEPPMKGKTPEATLAAMAYVEAKKGAAGLFAKTTKPGEFKITAKGRALVAPVEVEA
jgi:hypothetical protein